MNRPNIVYFHSHDTGRYVEPYGYAVPTPNYRRVAGQGVLFRNAHTAAPTCSPSRAALLTGQAPHAAGMLGLAHRGFRLTDPSQHLAVTLRDAGYATYLAGVQHVTTGDRAETGYEECALPYGFEPDGEVIGDAATAFIARDHDRPFFLDVGFFETHRVYPDVEPAAARYVRPPAPIPDTPETRTDMARYIESARRLDLALGRVLDALDNTGLAGTTILIVTTDHGLAFPQMKCNLTDHGTGVLLIMRGPGGLEGGRVIDGRVSQIDLFPTLCDLIGLERPAWATGQSLVPLIDGTAHEVNDAIFAEVTYHAAYEPQRAIRTGRHLYIRRFGDRTRRVLPNCDDGESRDVLLAHGWGDLEFAPEQLYDLLFDPVQAVNRIDDPALADVANDLRSRLDRWMEATDDPLRHGSVPLPVGARVNDPAATSFAEPLIEAQADGRRKTIENPRVNR